MEKNLKINPLNGTLKSISVFGRMIKFSHTIFALPFALAAVVLAQRHYPISLKLIFLILIAMIGARSAAMGFNRIADAKIDAENPRTGSRAIPSGTISIKAAAGFVILFSLMFIVASAMISDLCFILSIPVLIILFLYSLTKRFTALSHFFLGFAISLAPLASWIAVTGSFSPSILPLSLALFFYISGFDILYACQDIDFDKRTGLFSIPVLVGIQNAFKISAFFHLLTFILLLSVYFVFDMGYIFLTALLLIGICLTMEHHIVRPYNMKRINIAFFHMNSAISVILFLGILVDEML